MLTIAPPTTSAADDPKVVIRSKTADGTTSRNSFVTHTQEVEHSNCTHMGFFNTAPVAKPTVTGSRGGNAALASLLTALANLGLITNNTSA
jgi:hypothetical protein